MISNSHLPHNKLAFISISAEIDCNLKIEMTEKESIRSGEILEASIYTKNALPEILEMLNWLNSFTDRLIEEASDGGGIGPLIGYIALLVGDFIFWERPYSYSRYKLQEKRNRYCKASNFKAIELCKDVLSNSVFPKKQIIAFEEIMRKLLMIRSELNMSVVIEDWSEFNKSFESKRVTIYSDFKVIISEETMKVLYLSNN